jgi:hypothetical protein
MTAGENEYFASQDGSMIVFFKGISGLHRSHGHSERHMAANAPAKNLLRLEW